VELKLTNQLQKEDNPLLKKIEDKLKENILSPSKGIIHPSHPVSEKCRGRPKGVKNTYKSRWNPKKWKVEHEVIVLMHVNGKTNKEIATLNNRSEVYISLLINSDKAKEMIERIRSNLPVKSLEDRYSKIVNIATDRVIEYLEKDDLAQSTPGAMADRAMRAMEMIDSRLKVREATNVTHNTLVLATAENVDKLTRALARSDEVTANYRLKASNE
jgi:hypothetical protein